MSLPNDSIDVSASDDPIVGAEDDAADVANISDVSIDLASDVADHQDSLDEKHIDDEEDFLSPRSPISTIKICLVLVLRVLP